MDPALSVRAADGFDRAVLRELAELETAGLHRSLREAGDRVGSRVMIDGRSVVDFSSNDYLGLASDARVRRAMAQALECEGPGATASRSLGGNHPAHLAVERRAAALKRTEAALLFSSGYAANLGAIPALAGPDDVIYSDALNHASIVDGCRLARARVRIFPHNDLEALAGLLRAEGGRCRRRLIVVEGVYSMEGDLGPLPDLVELASRYDAVIYLDDAHATGVIGPHGGGSADHWALGDGVAVTVGTLGKAFGTAGAFVAGSDVLRDFLLNRARTFIFSTGPSPALARAAATAMDLAAAEPWRRERLRCNAGLLREALAGAGHPVAPDVVGPIIPVMIGEAARAVAVGQALLRRGFLVGAIRPPTVPPGTARLRLTVSAAHDPGEIARLVEALSQSLGEAS